MIVGQRMDDLVEVLQGAVGHHVMDRMANSLLSISEVVMRDVSLQGIAGVNGNRGGA